MCPGVYAKDQKTFFGKLKPGEELLFCGTYEYPDLLVIVNSLLFSFHLSCSFLLSFLSPFFFLLLLLLILQQRCLIHIPSRDGIFQISLKICEGY
jgi:hypothetical protein